MEIYEEILKDRESGTRRMVDEYRARLMSAARLLCSDSHEAEDLVFRAFEQAIRKIGDFRPVGSFYYWIYTILLNLRRMDARKRRARPQFVPCENLPEQEYDGADPFAQFVFRGSAEAVREAVRRLPENFREAVILRYFEDMSTGEIAKVTGVPEGTVRSRLHYAKNALYAMLCDTELSPDFTERLLKATRPKAWLFRRSSVASVVAVFGFIALAAGSVAILGSADVKSRSERVSSRQTMSLPERSDTGLWRTAGVVSLFDAESDDIDRAVEGGLKYLASQQRENGSFNGQWGETAAIPSLVGMAYLSKGHLPGTEPYGKTVERCLDYVFSIADMREQAPYRGYMGAAGDGKMYAHSIATLFLSEMSGMVDKARQKRIDALLPLAVKVILDAQNHPKSDGSQMGGWRYTPDASDSDLSCSGWALMALRSARLNGAILPSDSIEKAVLYIKRSQREGDGAFSYQGSNGGYGETLSGAGILCLELCGRHLDPCSLKAAEFVRKTFRSALVGNGAIYYALYYTSQGLFQIGGEAWKEFEAWMYGEFMRRQNADGSWHGGGSDGQSPVYCTAMTSLALTVPYRMLPIYQRDETVDNEEGSIQGEWK